MEREGPIAAVGRLRPELLLSLWKPFGVYLKRKSMVLLNSCTSSL
jgi:hypothetical protein